MALAPADFYAYSRATGVPVPEDPEERAQLAPEVLEFRRNQLKAPQQEANPLAALGAAAAGLGLLAGGLYAAKRFGAGRTLVQPSKVAGLTQEGISNVQAIAKQQNAEQLQRELSKQRPQGVVQTDLSAINRWLEDPGLLSEVELEESLATLNPAEARSELARQQARVQKAKREDLWNLVQQIQSETTVERQQVLEPQLAHQAISALESGEDQVTGRIMRGVQRNEDLDSSQVNALNQQTGNAAVTTSLIPDGIPEDQTDVTYFIQGKQFLQPGERLQQRASTVAKYQTPIQTSVIAKYPARSQDPQNLGRFPGAFGTVQDDTVKYSPAYGGVSNVIRRGNVEVTPLEGRIAGIPARFTALPPGTKTEGLFFNVPSSVVPLTKEDALNRLAEFQISKDAQIAKTMERGLSEARARRNVQITPTQQQAIEVLLPSYSEEDVMSQPGLKVYGDVGEAERFAEEQSSRSGKLHSLEQGGFLEQQVDPGELRTEPRTVRPGVMVSPASKTSYRGVIGRPGYGIYGEQAGGRAGEPVFGAGAVEASKEIKTEGEERGVTTPRKYIPGLDDPRTQTPEGFVYTEEALTRPTKAAGGYKKYATQPPVSRAASKESLDVSSQLRRIQQEEGPQAAQAFLDKIMQERQISSVGTAQPLRPTINRKGRFSI